MEIEAAARAAPQFTIVAYAHTVGWAVGASTARAEPLPYMVAYASLHLPRAALWLRFLALQYRRGSVIKSGAFLYGEVLLCMQAHCGKEVTLSTYPFSKTQCILAVIVAP